MIFKNNVVLIVDDSYTIRHQVKLLLRKFDLSVVEAYDHNSMISRLSFNNKPVDLIIMDLGLKKESGYQLMNTIRKDKNHNKTPIIVLTGNAKKDAVLASTQFEIMYYAIKPINPKDLSQKVLSAIEYSNRIQDVPNPLLEPAQKAPFDDLFDPFSIEDLDKKLKTTVMGQLNQVLEVDISSIKRSSD